MKNVSERHFLTVPELIAELQAEYDASKKAGVSEPVIRVITHTHDHTFPTGVEFTTDGEIVIWGEYREEC